MTILICIELFDSYDVHVIRSNLLILQVLTSYPYQDPTYGGAMAYAQLQQVCLKELIFIFCY